MPKYQGDSQERKTEQGVKILNTFIIAYLRGLYYVAFVL